MNIPLQCQHVVLTQCCRNVLCVFLSILCPWQVLIAPEGVVPVLQFLKDHHNAQFAVVSDITAMDVPSRHYRFEVGKGQTASVHCPHTPHATHRAETTAVSPRRIRQAISLAQGFPFSRDRVAITLCAGELFISGRDLCVNTERFYPCCS